MFLVHGEINVTAMLVATYYGYLEVVRLLLEEGADGNAGRGAVGALEVRVTRRSDCWRKFRRVSSLQNC